MSTNTTNSTTSSEEVVANPKPRFPSTKRFMGNEYEDMRLHLNELVIGFNLAHQYYAVEDKPTSLWRKLYNSLYHKDGLFSGYEQTINQKPLYNMKVKLFSSIYPEIKRLHDSIIQKRPPENVVVIFAHTDIRN